MIRALLWLGPPIDFTHIPQDLFSLGRHRRTGIRIHIIILLLPLDRLSFIAGIRIPARHRFSVNKGPAAEVYCGHWGFFLIPMKLLFGNMGIYII